MECLNGEGEVPINVLAAAFALIALVLSSAPGAHAAAEKLRIATTGGDPPFAGAGSWRKR